MSKILQLLVIIFLALVGITIFLAVKFSLTKENIIALAGSYAILFSIAGVYLQLIVNLNYNKRKAAADFSFDKIGKELYPLINELKTIVNKKDYLAFPTGTDLLMFLGSNDSTKEEKTRAEELVKSISNFFERMSSSVFKKVYDEDIIYDDLGMNFMQYYYFTKSHIEQLQKKYNLRIFKNFQELASRWEKRFINQDMNNDTSSIPKKKL